jgi:hypothetical protein
MEFTAVAIPLTRGKWTIVDVEDAPRVLPFRWHAKPYQCGKWYAARNVRDGSKQRTQLMHTFLLQAEEVDHQDGDGLNNRRKNLRPCTHAQNMQNMYHTVNQTGFKGVAIERRKGRSDRWIAQIRVNGKHRRIGRFKTPEEAHAAYVEAARFHFGEFAQTD